jgi:hypothetical protein
MVTVSVLHIEPHRSIHLFAAAFSQSCFSWPSWGLMSSGGSGMTQLLPGCTIAGVSEL